MAKISRTFKTKKEAYKFETKLFNKYREIELLYYPESGSGKYTWYVSY